MEVDQYSQDMPRNSLNKLIGKKGNIIDIGDFNLPNFRWAECELSVRPDRTVLVGRYMTVLLKYWMTITMYRL